MINENASKSRTKYIDFLKFVGMLCIILAHVSPPTFIGAIRDFDVPLMVIISGILGKKSYEVKMTKGLTPFNYILKRLIRLVAPTWFFLIIFFSLIHIFDGRMYDWLYYFESFAMTRYAIPFIWVVLVYCYCSAMIPFFNCLKGKVTFGFAFCVVMIVYVLYEFAYHSGMWIDSKIVNTTVYNIIPYGLIAFLGFSYSEINKKTRIIITLGSFIVFAMFAIYYFSKYGYLQPMSMMKYPARFYYVSYGVFVSFMLLQIFEKASCKLFESKIVLFVSKYSLRIYLWHILTMEIYERLKLPEIWYVKYFIVIAVTLLWVWIINLIAERIKHRFGIKAIDTVLG